MKINLHKDETDPETIYEAFLLNFCNEPFSWSEYPSDSDLHCWNRFIDEVFSSNYDN